MNKTTENAEKTILFVCTGNTCRSPMAEFLFNAFFSYTAHRSDSAGLFADGSPISENARHALGLRGIETGDHLSKPVTEELIQQADIVVGLTSHHAAELIRRFPAYKEKIYAMPKDIPDPFGGSKEDYKDCLRAIEQALLQIFPKEEEQK